MPIPTAGNAAGGVSGMPASTSAGSSQGGATGAPEAGRAGSTSTEAGASGEAGATHAPGTARPPSCVGLASSCGSSASDDCCASPTVPGGSFMIGNPNYAAHPADVTAFALDKYEVTVGRFRAFVSAYGGPPAAGAGAHPLIAGSGWQSAWDTKIAADSVALTSAVQCDAKYPVWDASGAHDALPMNCVSWYEAFAFCAWDGGRLPTETEWAFAVRAGAEQRLYAWGNTPVPDDKQDSTSAYANYFCLGDGDKGGGLCSLADILPVGSKPLGAGKYGQVDLLGSVWEWELDSASPTAQCSDCASLGGEVRVFNGGSWYEPAGFLTSSNDQRQPPDGRTPYLGVRCARANK
ncbi:MAG: SUMF1/EgtB/PvdO family nonheme iron enzyme [Polyangiaceae bacterium]